MGSKNHLFLEIRLIVVTLVFITSLCLNKFRERFARFLREIVAASPDWGKLAGLVCPWFQKTTWIICYNNEYHLHHTWPVVVSFAIFSWAGSHSQCWIQAWIFARTRYARKWYIFFLLWLIRHFFWEHMFRFIWQGKWIAEIFPEKKLGEEKIREKRPANVLPDDRNFRFRSIFTVSSQIHQFQIFTRSHNSDFCQTHWNRPIWNQLFSWKIWFSLTKSIRARNKKVVSRGPTMRVFNIDITFKDPRFIERKIRFVPLGRSQPLSYCISHTPNFLPTQASDLTKSLKTSASSYSLSCSPRFL